MNSFEKELEKKISFLSPPHSEVAKSISILVLRRGKCVGRVRLGKKYKYYDLSSLTKIIFSMTAVMNAIDQKKINLNSPVKKYLPWFPSFKTKVGQLLAHNGGLEWWLPLYKKMNRKGDWQARRGQILQALKKMHVGPSGPVVYSDVDFWTLGFILEKVYNQDLFTIFKETKSKFGKTGFHFAVDNKPPMPRSQYAPTEKCPWRKKVLRGEVHDDNTWAFGGVSTHAGLFGSIDDLEVYGQFLRKKVLSKKYSKIFRRQGQSDWCLGFMMPSKMGSSAGRYLSKKSIGHLGFTGTSIWYDPKRDLVIVILSNRVHPSRKNNNIRKFRPAVHDAVIEVLDRKRPF